MSPERPHIDTSSGAWSERGITALTLQTPTSTAVGKAPSTKPSRWKTTEFLVYGVVAMVVIPYMVYVPISLSQPWHPNHPKYEHKLSPGWIAGRKVDNSDHQYRNFRNNLLPLLSLALGYLGTSYLYSRFSNTRRILTGKRSDNVPRLPFIAGFALCMLIGLHGASALKVLAILAANYWIGKTTAGTIVGPVVNWAFNLGILIVNELADGYKFAALHPSLTHLDTWEGFYPRWHITFNITMLRLLSFNMDYHWACTRQKAQNAREDSIPLNTKQRCATAHKLDSYNPLNYFAYVVYPPLYIAGPIMTFNDFYWQFRRPVHIERGYTISYFRRFLFCLLTMEFILHFMYVVAIKDTRTWQGASPMELSMVGFWNLIILWLKLLLPWRFFRLWALVDGVEPVENIVRCVANNYSAAGFWRSWHRSYNQWLLRYIYIPIGGRGSGILATILVFTFVALWHDLTFRLLVWGWFISLFFLPEMLLTRMVTAEKFGDKPWYRHVCALGGVANVLMMMTGNLVGFVIGTDGMNYLAGEILGTWYGLQFLVAACGALFIGVQFMFEYREEEMRHGTFRKY